MMSIDVLASAENAECLVLDFASAPVRRQHEMPQPRLAGLPAARCLRSGSTAELAEWHTPAVGAGLAVLLGGNRPASPMPAGRLAGSIEFVLPALLILDTTDDEPGLRTVACILGSAPARFDPVGIRTAGSLLRRNGELVGTGAPGVLLGSPLAALLRLVETAGRPPTADSCLLLGSITPTVPAEAGDRFDLRVAGLGGVSGRLDAAQPQRSER